MAGQGGSHEFTYVVDGSTPFVCESTPRADAGLVNPRLVSMDRPPASVNPPLAQVFSAMKIEGVYDMLSALGEIAVQV